MVYTVTWGFNIHWEVLLGGPKAQNQVNNRGARASSAEKQCACTASGYDDTTNKHWSFAPNKDWGI